MNAIKTHTKILKSLQNPKTDMQRFLKGFGTKYVKYQSKSTNWLQWACYWIRFKFPKNSFKYEKYKASLILLCTIVSFHMKGRSLEGFLMLTRLKIEFESFKYCIEMNSSWTLSCLNSMKKVSKIEVLIRLNEKLSVMSAWQNKLNLFFYIHLSNLFALLPLSAQGKKAIEI